MNRSLAKRSLVSAIVLPLLAGLGGLTGGLATAAGAGSPSARIATARTATFTVENMTCALCPVTVRKAMEAVPGVASVEVDFDAKTATVVFDPAVTNVEAIAAASTNAGYPATIKG